MKHKTHSHILNARLKPILFAVIGAGVTLFPLNASANGYLESRPWQFATPSERQTNAFVADMIARRQGGYYDGFQTNVSNVTNIGTQVNCNNVADATANRATNSQVANSPQVQLASNFNSSAAGNTSTTPMNGPGSSASDQSNTGAIGSSISGSDGSARSGAIRTGNSDQHLGNHQENSGNQSAQINDSTACDFNNSEVTGSVDRSGNAFQPVSPPN